MAESSRTPSGRREAESAARLAAAMQKQMDAWSLSPAEREIGLLMLKGFVHKQIATLRGTTEATVRHQARAIYAKAGVHGRAGFCAFFLESLLVSPVAGKGQASALTGAAALPRR